MFRSVNINNLPPIAPIETPSPPPVMGTQI